MDSINNNNNNNNNNNENYTSGAELKDVYYKDLEKNVQLNSKKDYSDDEKHSIALLICGVFFWLPFFFNVIYIRSPSKKARSIALSSIVLACVYTLVVFVPLYAFAWDYRDYYERNSGYYDRNNGYLN